MAPRREVLPPPVITPAPEPPPESLAEFLARHVTLTGGGLARAEVPSARFAVDLISAAAEGREPPRLDGLTSRDMYLVADLLDDLLGKSRGYLPATPLLCQVRREYNDRIQIRRRQGLPPVAVARSLAGPGFCPNPGALSSPGGEVGKLLGDLADSATAAAQALRAVVAGRRDAAIGLDEHARTAVTALLEAARRQARERGEVHVQDVELIASEWRGWAASQSRHEARASAGV